jgi:hypothetical protein
MPDVYMMTFRLQPRGGYNPESALLASLQEWVGRKCPDAPTLTMEQPLVATTGDKSILRWEPFRDDTRILAEFAWRHPHVSAPSITWGTTVSYLRKQDDLYLTIRVANTGPEIGSSGALLTTRPRLLVHLVEFFSVHSGDGPCGPQPEILHASDIPKVVHYDLTWPGRTRATLVLSPTENGSYLLDPHDLTREFLSLARVYVIDSPKSTFVLTDELRNRSMSCFRGAARVYLPGFDYGSDPMKHPLLLPHALVVPERRMRIAQFLAASTVQRFGESQDLVDMRNHLRDFRAAAYADAQRQRLLQLEARLTEKDEELWGGFSSENGRLLADNEDLRRRLAEAEAKVEHLETDKRALLYQLRSAQGSASPIEALPLPEPYDVVEAVEIASEMLSDGLVVLPSATEAAADSPYRFPQRVLDTLQMMAEVARKRAHGELGMPLREAFRERNVDYRPAIADATSNRHRTQYEFTYLDEVCSCEEHICLGGGYDPASNLRIYFTSRHPREGRFVIGHVGRHLESKSSN